MNVSDIEKLIELYGNAIYGFCRRLAINKSDTDDLYQQTFLRAMELKEKIDKDNNPKGYLISLAVSIWKNQIRKKARRHRIAPTMSIDEEAWGYIPVDGSNIEDEILSNEIISQVNKIVSNIDDKFKIPIIMFYNGDLSIEEISVSLKIPQGTVKSRLHKGRQIIKKELEVKGFEGYE